ncbi:uncharacterized protein LOC110811620 [Carica papaya]|uniref:uncharacterized protein LOC110811620 n=1 Tax=Carica papaya TaxID=3649 RepID=UPI000B8CEE48|nr:uncharacterized protein LOC110811620 [Carica papaya]
MTICLDAYLIPLSLFLTLGYHAYLWHIYKNKPSATSIGILALRRKYWFLTMKQGRDDKKIMLGVQSLRNALMVSILTAIIAIMVNVALAALTNNAYKERHLFSAEFMGSESGRISVVKYGSASLFLLVSFLCSSMAVGYLVDANFLIINGWSYTRSIMERGFVLGFVGSRMLCITFPLLLWMFGPIAVLLSSAGLVWVLYDIDFASKFHHT